MTDDSSTPAAKGRPTPSRKDAEAARKAQMKQPMTRKEKMLRDRAARDELRTKQREALRSGRGDALPARDRGPVKAFVRDFVDRRWNVAEFLLPVLVFILLMNFIQQPWAYAAVSFLWAFVVVGTVLDEIVMIRGLRKELARRFSDTSTKGSTAYAVLRSSQLRRFRLPPAVIKRSGELKPRY